MCLADTFHFRVVVMSISIRKTFTSAMHLHAFCDNFLRLYLVIFSQSTSCSQLRFNSGDEYSLLLNRRTLKLPEKLAGAVIVILRALPTSESHHTSPKILAYKRRHFSANVLLKL